jgi:putative endonuclease
MYYIYIIYSESADMYYIGSTDAPQRRIEEHNTSYSNTFTSKFRPWAMAALFECSYDRATAMRIEKFIKKQKSRTLIEIMVSGAALSGELAQLVKVPHLRD